MLIKRLSGKYLFVIITVFFTMTLGSLKAQTKSQFDHFITAKGDRLYDGPKEFRFISYNIPNLLTVEDNMPFAEINPWRLPDDFEIQDALKSIVFTGGQVARSYVITVKRKVDKEDMPKYVLGPGEFNEEAFKTLDLILAKANEIGVRLIIPLIDNWKWMGGRPQYENFRGKEDESFWTDSQLIDDFKMTIKAVVGRTNTITGQKYADDKAIMVWELGNELRGVKPSWFNEMAKYIKSMDSNHLVNEGQQSSNLLEAAIASPDIDVLSTHHYESSPENMLHNIRNAAAAAKGKKPYYVGEFGFLGTNAFDQILDDIIKTENISGALIWSLRFHNRDGGFYWHSEPMGSGIYKAYHLPGFAAGTSYDEKNVVNLMRQKAFEIRGMPELPILKPEAPKLLPIKSISKINWQGSVGTDSYVVERMEQGSGKWMPIGNPVEDTWVAYGSLFSDKTGQIGKTYSYRIKARNPAGESDYSNIVGPVTVSNKTIIDEMQNIGVMYHRENETRYTTGWDRNFKEDFHRVSAEEGANIYYLSPGQIIGIKLMGFAKSGDRIVKFFGSEDGQSFKEISSEISDLFPGDTDYKYWHPVLVTANKISQDFRLIKIECIEESQIGRIEIKYGK